MELKGDRYATISDIQTFVMTKLKTITITDFLRAMHQLENRTNQSIAVTGASKGGHVGNIPPLIDFYVFNNNMRKNKNDKLYMLVRLNSYRLNGSALANMHKDISVEISELVDTFVSTKPRCMVMSDWSGDE